MFDYINCLYIFNKNFILFLVTLFLVSRRVNKKSIKVIKIIPLDQY